MKRIIVICLMALTAVYGCQVNELVEVDPESKSFTASIEDNCTKTSLDDQGNVLFKQGDQMSIFVGSTINEQYQVTDDSDGKTSASLIKVTGPGFVAGGEIDNNIAFYPYAPAITIAKNGSAFVLSDITLPSTQTYAAGSFGNGAFPMAAVTSNAEDMHLKFKNVLGGVKLQLTGTAMVKSVSISGNGNEILCGAAEVTVSNTSTPTISLTDASAKTVTLDCGDGVQLNSETATSFIIALPPMTMEGGFTVVVTDTEGKQMEIKTTKPQTINRTTLLKMPEVAYEGTPAPSGPLTFTSTGETSIALTKVGSPDDISLEYKAGIGDWMEYTIGEAVSLIDGQTVSFRAGAEGNDSFSKSFNDYYKFSITGSGTVAASGNIMSLISQEETSAIPSAYCFQYLFRGCAGLTMAPELPATTLAEYCYQYMFSGCTGLTTAPELPATNLAYGCYASMFRGCTSLTSAPELPATTLADLCYSNMFMACTGLTTAPELPATTLVHSCYNYMFYGCTSLTIAPELPATKLASLCYNRMFDGCTSLTTAPELPATTLVHSCYACMFNGCTSLTSAPELPVTNLAYGCYSHMFYGCTSLTTAPELPATKLAEYCYQYMFNGCSQLNYIKCLATDLSATDCLSNWVDGVSPSGVFIKNPDTTWPTGTSGIPEGWTIYPTGLPSNAEAIDLGLSVKWANMNVGATTPEEYGDYFAWGETEPKTDYSWKTYKWCNGTDHSLTKYNTDIYFGIVDNKTTVEPEDDAAHANWGGNWRMPTEADFDELRDTLNCSWVLAEENGIYGYWVTSKKAGYTDKSIFIPASGGFPHPDLSYPDAAGYYWASSTSTRPDCAWTFRFYTYYPYIDWYSIFGRCAGESIRPVCE